MEHFNQSIDIIRGLQKIDAILVTGDVSDDGSEWTYQYADRLFSTLGIPTLCCPGNHDSLKMMLEEYKPSFCKFLPPSSIIDGWKIVMLNSVIPADENPDQNKARGFLSDESLDYVIQELEEGLPTIIALHHPPLEPGGWLNRRLLENRDEFNQTINRYPNARLVIYGHIHYFSDVQKGHIRSSSSTSVGFAFDKDLPKFQIADGLEGFSLIEINNDIIDITNVKLYNIFCNNQRSNL
jgi:Icc protein